MFHFKEEDLTNEQSKRIIQKAFTKTSSSANKDLLNKTDFKCAWLYLFGYKITKYELQEYFEKLGKNYYTDCLNFDEFEKKVMNEVRRLDNIEELRNAFITIDFSCKGFLTLDDFTKHFQLIAPNLCQNIVSDIFREMDRDSDGRVSYKDFEFAMEYINDACNKRVERNFEF